MKKRLCTLVLATALLSGCTLPGLSGTGEDGVRIGSVISTEAMILSHMNRLMIEEYTDIPVSIMNNLGTSVVAHQAMVSGDINISSMRYTGTDIASVLGMDAIMDPEEALRVVQEELDKRYNHQWFDSYGFANTYAFAVREDFGEEHGLETISDLKKVADDITVGVDTSWLDRDGDGYGGFQEVYGFSFNDSNVSPMQIGLVYDAVASGRRDAVLAYSTDGRIAAYDLRILEDDKQFFPPYDASTVVDKELLAQYPELEDVLGRLSGKISAAQMQQMNYEADANLKEPATVAEEFLQAHNYFRDEEGGGS
ncbi:osmoprotectant ABC transporter substrate-binding protein [Bacillus sp. FSL W7-1360]